MTRMLISIFILDEHKPVNGYICHVFQVVFNLSYFCLDACNEFIGLVFIKLQDTLHLDFHEPENVITRHFTNEIGLERCEFQIDKSNSFVHIRSLFKLLFLIDALLNEYPFETGKEELFEQFAPSNLQFLAQKSHRSVHSMAQHIADRKETRLVVFDNTTVGRDVYLTITESI